MLEFEKSPQFNKTTQQFDNRRPGLVAAMRKRLGGKNLWYDWFLRDDQDREPESRLPEMKPDLNMFKQASAGVKFLWFGHSTLLLNLGGTLVLMDPIFSNAASPVPFFVRRYQPPVVPLQRLPKIDYVLISHDHYDHLDRDTVKHFRGKQTRFLVPLGVGSHLRGWGIDPKNIQELAWWESFEHQDLRFTATPAQHFSGRGLLEQNRTLWAVGC